jgi:hypothetical protein
LGWRGREQHFLELLKEGITKPVKLMIAAGKAQYAKEPEAQIGAVVKVSECVVCDGGFTEFVLRNELQALMAD